MASPAPKAPAPFTGRFAGSGSGGAASSGHVAAVPAPQAAPQAASRAGSIQLTASELVGSESTAFRYDAGVTIPLQTGGTLELSVPFNRLSTNNQFGPGAMVTISERELCVPVVENP